ncbi:MAG: DUF4381 domain-containing protein [Mariprofundaceae bacterium]|nr:DUF4381 domain-containing protein [Mariprofundaceae bacterium]
MGDLNQLENALNKLKDIHMPAPEAWWQLALGWYLVIGIGIFLILFGILLWPRMRAWHQKKTAKKILKKSIQDETQRIEDHYTQTHDSLALVANLSTLLRRVSMTVFKTEQTQGLIQDAWLQFLDNTWQGNKPTPSFTSTHIAELLKTGAYRQQLGVNMQQDSEILFDICKKWLNMVVKQHV